MYNHVGNSLRDGRLLRVRATSSGKLQARSSTTRVPWKFAGPSTIYPLAPQIGLHYRLTRGFLSLNITGDLVISFKLKGIFTGEFHVSLPSMVDLRFTMSH